MAQPSSNGHDGHYSHLEFENKERRGHAVPAVHRSRNFLCRDEAAGLRGRAFGAGEAWLREYRCNDAYNALKAACLEFSTAKGRCMSQVQGKSWWQTLAGMLTAIAAPACSRRSRRSLRHSQDCLLASPGTESAVLRIRVSPDYSAEIPLTLIR
jgi:hypothetical protein